MEFNSLIPENHVNKEQEETKHSMQSCSTSFWTKFNKIQLARGWNERKPDPDCMQKSLQPHLHEI